jgi:CRISPR type I-E-associated protein CasA/Cse1
VDIGMVKKNSRNDTIGKNNNDISIDISVNSEAKKTRKRKNVTLDHGLHFNLLTEPWLPAVGLDGEKKFLSLNDFLLSAHELERFDFPLPGLETAVMRFLVAMVHIAGAPQNKQEWEAWLARGKFDDAFINGLRKYEDKLDLFSPTEPFMQVVDITEDKMKTVEKLIEFFPSGNNHNHFGIIDCKIFNNQRLSPAAGAVLLIFHQMIPRNAKAGPYEQYSHGLLGQKPPYYLWLKGDNLYFSIIFNVFDNDYAKSNLKNKVNVLSQNNNWIVTPQGELNSKEISIPVGLLWKSRSILLIPEKEENSKCSITGELEEILIKNIYYAPQVVTLKNYKTSPWEDVFNSIVISREKKKSGDLEKINKLSPAGRDLPAWKDYPALILTDNRQTKNEKGNTVDIKINQPLILQRYLSYGIYKYIRNVTICVLCVTTKEGQDKLFRIEESNFPFSVKFIDNDKYAQKIKEIVIKIQNFEREITNRLYEANAYKEKLDKLPENKRKQKEREIKNKIRSLFQSSYWHELGSAFEESLAELAETEKDPNEVLREWKILLAGHVRDTFKRHTQKLLINPKHLKHYNAARVYLENRIRKELLPVKNNDTQSVSEGAGHA